MAEEWQPVTVACQTLGISERTLYRRMEKGILKSKLEDGRRLILIPDDRQVTDNMAGMTDTQELDELKADNTRLEQELDRLKQQLNAAERKAVLANELSSDKEMLSEQLDNRDEQIVNLQEQLNAAEHRAVLADELSRDKERLLEHLANRDNQIVNLQEQLSEAGKRHDTVTLKFTQLLENYQPFWRRLFRRKQLPPVDEVVMDIKNDKGGN